MCLQQRATDKSHKVLRDRLKHCWFKSFHYCPVFEDDKKILYLYKGTTKFLQKGSLVNEIQHCYNSQNG